MSEIEGVDHDAVVESRRLLMLECHKSSLGGHLLSLELLAAPYFLGTDYDFDNIDDCLVGEFDA